MKRSIQYILACMSLFSLAACTDDLTDDIGGGIIPEGECAITANVGFKPLASGLNGATRSAGGAIKEIKSLCVLLYDSDGKLVKKYAGNDLADLEIEEADRTDADADNGHKAESRTPHADFSLNVPYGRYYIYAVANMEGLEGYDVSTVGNLKSIALEWRPADVAANNQMFGFFTVADDGKEPADAPLITVAQSEMSLHSWIRRAASKVTVAFDASGLKDNIYIYLKSVQIKDIPSHCWLGKDNTPGKDAPEDTKLISDGEKIVYSTSDSYDDNYPARLTNGRPVYGAANLPADAEGRISKDEQIAIHHEENVSALYFYENMQGEGISKRQDWDGDKKVEFPDGSDKDDSGNLNSPNRKDRMLNGTYIEVKAHYVSRNAGDMSDGEITYRFMLGKDTEKNYDAQRNYHYKLTMKFKGYANDVDWHIDYEREPGMVIPNPYYISYLYNHSMMLPIQVNTKPRVEVTGLKAEIVDNRWAPDNARADFDYYRAVDREGENMWNGFLSLHETTETVITGTKPFTKLSNQAYYEQTPKRGERIYADMTTGTHTTAGSKDTDKYSVKVEESAAAGNVYHFSLPMYTRAKQLIKETAYTGNNPYVAYQRKAVVRITATLSDGGEYKEDVTIYQVRRIVNPKGVWREWNGTEPFHVVLKRLPMESATKFETFNSVGPWRAYVIRDSDPKGTVKLSVADSNISSEGKADIEFDGETVTKDIISGRTDTPIDFNIEFNGTAGDANSSRYAIVRVEYHNYSCYHLIFVRQGDSPDALVDGGTRWHAVNMVDAATEAASPVEEGSLFKFGNLDQPIRAEMNKNSKEPWINVKPDYFGTNVYYPQNDWVNNKSKNHKASFGDLTGGMRVASYGDFAELYNAKDIEQGFGVLYGNGATETLDDIDQVYGYQAGKSTAYGMRGCFVYNRNTGKNLFFPMGASGYGHRKDRISDGATTHRGVLRYSSSSRWGTFPKDRLPADTSQPAVYPNGVEDCPLFYDLYMRPGAVYWFDKESTDKSIDPSAMIGWDFNYFTFDFFPISASNVFGTQIGDWQNRTYEDSDACFVRCVED